MIIDFKNHSGKTTKFSKFSQIYLCSNLAFEFEVFFPKCSLNIVTIDKVRSKTFLAFSILY